MTVIQEGNRFQRFYKHCRCKSPSSGPRVVFREGKRRPVVRPDVVEIDVMLVALACDECDTPWETTYPFGVYAEGP